MTEDEVIQLTTEVLGPYSESPSIMKSWFEGQLQSARKAEQEEVCAFKFHKFMGKHDQMKLNAANIKDIRQAIAYFEKELECITES